MPAQPMGGEGSVAGKGTHPKFHLREGDSCTLARERVCLASLACLATTTPYFLAKMPQGPNASMSITKSDSKKSRGFTQLRSNHNMMGR